MSESFVPIEDIAKHFSVSISTVRAWVRQKHIPEDTYIKIGSTYRFRVSDVESALTSSKKEEVRLPIFESDMPPGDAITKKYFSGTDEMVGMNNDDFLDEDQ
tara:strand:- start:26 stop:331 length:306 start_codon:yes stop_codon:yes gene_type:complete